MIKCYRCPYTNKIKRKYGYTIHCGLESTNMAITYYCSEKHKDEDNELCPLIKRRNKK